jgi:hypothetical protein
MKSLTGMTTVDDLFDIRQGIRTGHKKVYILDDEQFSELPDLEKEYFRPAVVNESIKFGYLRRIAYAFFPHGKQNEFNNENELVERLLFILKPICFRISRSCKKEPVLIPRSGGNFNGTEHGLRNGNRNYSQLLMETLALLLGIKKEISLWFKEMLGFAGKAR